jgi:hypothetical protein
LTETVCEAYPHSMPVDSRLEGFSSELMKIGARKGLKLIRQLLAKGTPESLAKAERLAISPGVLKKTQAGSQVRHLGSGMEGVSTITAHPKRGIEVRKLIDPKGVAGEGMVAQREAAGRALSGSSDVAAFRGARTTPGGLREQRFAYAQPSPSARPSSGLAAGTPGEMSTAVGSGRGRAMASTPSLGAGTGSSRGMDATRRQQAQMKRLRRQGERAGFNIQDLHEGNVIAGPGGAGRAVDFMAVPGRPIVGPVPRGASRLKSAPGAKYTNPKNTREAFAAQAAADKGMRTPYLDYMEDPRRAGNIAARAYRSAPPLTPGSSTALRQRAQGVTSGTIRAKATTSRPVIPIPKRTGMSTAIARPKGKQPRPTGPAAAMSAVRV